MLNKTPNTISSHLYQKNYKKNNNKIFLNIVIQYRESENITR